MVEAERQRQEAAAAKRAAAMEVWSGNQRLRRAADRELKGEARYSVAKLCELAEDYSYEFFSTFFSPEYCGFEVEYDVGWKGWRFPEEAGEISEFLFSRTGSLFIGDGTTKGELVPEWNFVMTYGHFVCGYPLNAIDRFSSEQYARSIRGFSNCLVREKAKRDRTLFEYGSEGHWKDLLEKVTVALFTGIEDGRRYEAPRTLFGLVATCFEEAKESTALYPELASEKTFRAFLEDCLEGGKLYDRSLRYFRVRERGRSKVRKFEIVFNPECLADEPNEEELTKEDEKKLRALMEKCPVIFV
jgi:hypothetical protein